ncbi:hypothetical protein VTP01DRAFT_5602 [Rhizomucor pusillus]|uniref:uncharacterized protein n=1 Tax=Rhizomucor pusillus TaxID=4840 RepID=UPI003742BD94
MSAIAFNILWILCVVLLLFALFLAIRRRRLASRQQDAPETFIYRQQRPTTQLHTIQVHTAPQYYDYSRFAAAQSSSNPEVELPPPVYKPEDLPPPSYQEYSKDRPVQQSSSSTT